MAKIKIEKNFGSCPNDLLYDKQISLKAKGLYAYIQAKSEDWDFSARGISYETKDGMDGIQAGLNELEKSGYLTRKRFQNKKGHWDVEYTLRIIPLRYIPGTEIPTQEIPTQEIPVLENPVRENPVTYKTREIKQEEENKNNISDFEKIADENSMNVYPVFLYYFLKLGWKPSKGETVEGMKEWAQTTLTEGGLKSPDDMKLSIREFYRYWETRKLEKGFGNKNWKTTLLNSISLPKNKNKYATPKK